MAGTLVVTEKCVPEPPTKVVTFEWTSDASGGVNSEYSLELNGTVSRAKFIPDDTDVPADLYDVAILDEDGVDVLDGQGADRSATLKQAVVGFGEVMCSRLQLVVTGAGNAKKGIVILHIRRDI